MAMDFLEFLNAFEALNTPPNSSSNWIESSMVQFYHEVGDEEVWKEVFSGVGDRFIFVTSSGDWVEYFISAEV